MHTTMSRYLADLGYEFDPNDEELVGYYLFNKLIGREISDEEKIYVREYDLYGKEEPSEIWNKFEGKDDKDLFFITALKHLKKRNNEKGLRYDRKVGSNGGKWHGEDAGKEFDVLVSVDGTAKKCVRATRKRFNYRNPGSDQHCLWIMHEYSLKMNDPYVICRLRKNVHGAKHRGKKRVANAAAAAECVEDSANKRMRETVPNSALQCPESSFTGPDFIDHSSLALQGPFCNDPSQNEKQNQLVQHDYSCSSEYDTALALENENVEANSEAEDMTVDEWLACIDDQIRFEKQNQLVEREHICCSEYDSSEIIQSLPSELTGNQNIEATFHSAEASLTGSCLGSSKQQEACLLVNQNVEALSVVEDVSSAIGDPNAASCDTSSQQQEALLLENHSVEALSAVEDVSSAIGDPGAARCDNSSGQQDALLLEYQSVESISEGEGVSSTIGHVDSLMTTEEWVSCISEWMHNSGDGNELLDDSGSTRFEEINVAQTSCLEPAQSIAAVQDTDFQGETSSCLDDFSSALLKISSFGQQEFEYWTLCH